MMEKRTIIAIILTFLVIVVWGMIQSKYFPSETPSKPEKEVVRKEEAPSVVKKVEEEPSKATTGKPTAPSKEGPKKEVLKKEVTVETQDYVAVFTSDGARLKHFRLKKYFDRVKESAITIQLTNFVGGILGKQGEKPREPEPLDLVNTDEAEGLPLGVIIDSNPSLSAGNWEVESNQLRLLSPGENGEVAFSKTLDNGLKIVKRFRFSSEKDTMELEVEIQNTTGREIPVQVGLEWKGKVELKKLAATDNKDYGLKYAFLKGEKVEKKSLGESSSSGCTPGCGSVKTTIESFDFIDRGKIEWFSFEGEYFASMLIPPPTKGDVTLTVKGVGDKNLLQANLTAPAVSVASGQAIKIPYRIYMGPVRVSQLKELNVGAEKLIDFGFFNVVAKPLLWFLNLSQSVTKNFGIDIIILSILIKIIFLPLTQISFKSMKEMQKVQPEMARLKEMYKNDKARLQQEMMLLYKRRKINPMSGCLPMLIQIPVFIALYNVLQSTFEMRQAPFFLWIRDLSAKDPIYLTPLVMGASMVIQQKMTPTAADPAQAKMFMLMPIMFTFMFLNFPSGLVLYWLVNNVLSIAHQYYLNKQ
jgi:YidC/Oxa1 family membrane protein insertase